MNLTVPACHWSCILTRHAAPRHELRQRRHERDCDLCATLQILVLLNKFSIYVRGGQPAKR